MDLDAGQMKYLLLAGLACLASLSRPAIACDSLPTLSIVRDELTEFENEYNQYAQDNNAPIATRAVEYNLRGPPTASPQQRLSCLLDRVLKVRRALLERRFKEPTASELRSINFSKERVLQQVKDRMPFGMRHRITTNFRDFLMFGAEPACAERGGLVGGYVLIIDPETEDAKDFGTIVLMLTGIGRCSRTIPMNGYFMDRAEQEVDGAIGQGLGASR